MLRNKRGFTLIEVIVSIALLGILSVAFLPSVSGYFKWIVDTKTNVTKKAFEAQDNMEIAIQKVTKAMKSGTIAAADYTSLNISEKIEVKLFTSDFSGYASRQYPTAYKVEISESGSKKFVSLVGDKRLPELPVPVINTVSRVFIKNDAEKDSTHEYFNYPNLKIMAKSNMTDNPGNSFNRYRSDWYVSKPGFIIPIQDIGNINEDSDFGRIYPGFPDDYIALPIYSELGSAYSYINATERRISAELKNDIVNKHPGRHILYTITPFAKSLKKGSTSSLLPLYIYGPDVTTSLVLHLDASTINMSDKYHASTNTNGTILHEDNEHYIRRWKNSRTYVETESTNTYNAIQTTKANMPVLIKNNDPEGIFMGPEIPFQAEDVDGSTVYSVWGRALGNKLSATINSNMTITGINSGINNDWSMFLVMRRVNTPLAPTNGPIIKNNSGTNWSLGWGVAGSNFQLQLNAPTNQISLPNIPDDWLLVHAKSTASAGMSLKAKSLNKNSTYNQYASGTGTININDINILFNGVEISEVLLYNSNMNSDDIDKIEEYLTSKYNPD